MTVNSRLPTTGKSISHEYILLGMWHRAKEWMEGEQLPRGCGFLSTAEGLERSGLSECFPDGESNVFPLGSVP